MNQHYVEVSAPCLPHQPCCGGSAAPAPGGAHGAFAAWLEPVQVVRVLAFTFEVLQRKETEPGHSGHPQGKDLQASG